MDDIPRRIQVDRMVGAELAIRGSKMMVEELGCHVLLTEAINLLTAAQEKVADFVDGKGAPGEEEKV